MTICNRSIQDTILKSLMSGSGITVVKSKNSSRLNEPLAGSNAWLLLFANHRSRDGHETPLVVDALASTPEMDQITSLLSTQSSLINFTDAKRL